MFSTFQRPIVAAFTNSVRSNTLVGIAKMSSSKYNFETLSVTVPKSFVYHVQLNRPEKLNAMNNRMWLEIKQCFEELNADEDCRVVILSGAGKIFTAGLDLQGLMELAPQLAAHEDAARKAKVLSNFIKTYQKSFTSLELCQKPVIAAIHSGCIGAGVNVIAAADMRYCTKDAWFELKEVNIGMAPDVGALQRLPKIIGSESFTRELAFTGRKVPSSEALSSGLVSRVFDDKESLINGSLQIAEEIAKKSPVAVQGTKIAMVYARDHTVQEGLDQIADWNQLMLQSEDFSTAATAQVTKQTDVVFSKL